MLAGGSASRLAPLTARLPKCLLPVANRRLLALQLELLVRAGFSEALVVVNEAHEDALTRYVGDAQWRAESAVLASAELTLQLLVVSDYTGSAGALLKAKDRLKAQHVLVLSADLALAPQELHALLERHRAREAALTALLYEEKEEEGVKHGKERPLDLLGLEPKTQRFLWRASSNELDASAERLELPRALLKRFPSFALHTTLRDAHCYALARWTLDLLEQRRELLQSVPRHFVPHVLALQYKTRAQAALTVPALVSAEARAMSAKRGHEGDAVRCYALIAEGTVARATDLPSYLALSRALAADALAPYTPSEPLSAGKQRAHIATTALIDAATVVPSGCVIGEGTRVGARVGVKRSVIGRHCVIGAGAKILNSVLMDHVTVAEGARIHNSVLSANCYVEKEAELTDCVLGERCAVNAALTLTKRKLDANTQLPQ